MNDSQTHFLKLLQEKPKYSKLKYHLCNSSQNSAIQDQFHYELKFLEFCQPYWSAILDVQEAMSWLAGNKKIDQ